MTGAQLEAMLAELGATHAEVARTLLGGGCRGLRLSGTLCPVASYAEKRVGRPVFVTAESCRIAEPGKSPSLVSCRTPAAVALFVERFDAGEYPELDSMRYWKGVAP